MVTEIRIGSLLALLPFALVGLLMLFAGLYGLFKVMASRSWPSVRGRITASGIREKQKKDRIKYKPQVQYSYVVAGRNYSSNNLTFGGRRPLRSRSEAESYMQDFVEGKEVEVFYNPRNPAEACLVPGDTGANLTVIVIALVMLGFLSMFALVATRA